RAVLGLDELADALVLPLADVDLIGGLLVDDEDVLHRAYPSSRSARRCSSSLRIAVSVFRSPTRPSRHARRASAIGTKRTSARSSTGLPSSVGVPADEGSTRATKKWSFSASTPGLRQAAGPRRSKASGASAMPTSSSVSRAQQRLSPPSPRS